MTSSSVLLSKGTKDKLRRFVSMYIHACEMFQKEKGDANVVLFLSPR